MRKFLVRLMVVVLFLMAMGLLTGTVAAQEDDNDFAYCPGVSAPQVLYGNSGWTLLYCPNGQMRAVNIIDQRRSYPHLPDDIDTVGFLKPMMSASGNSFVVQTGNTAYLYMFGAVEPVAVMPISILSQVAISADGYTVAAMSDTEIATYTYEPAKGQVAITHYVLPDNVEFGFIQVPAIAVDAHQFVFSAYNKESGTGIWWYDLESGEAKQLDSDYHVTTALAINPVNGEIAGMSIAAPDGMADGVPVVKIYDARQGTSEFRYTLNIPQEPALGVLDSKLQYTPDGKYLIGMRQSQIGVWDVETGNLVASKYFEDSDWKLESAASAAVVGKEFCFSYQFSEGGHSLWNGCVPSFVAQ